MKLVLQTLPFSDLNNDNNRRLDDDDTTFDETFEKQKQKETDTELAAALHQLSIDDREQIYEDIHGIQAYKVEPPHVVNAALCEMERVLQSIPDKPAFDLAMQQNPAYLQDPKLRLCFLRAFEFDASLSANNLVQFMEKKRQYFGDDTLGRRVYLSDLEPEDLELLSSGYLQILPQRDRGGRLVIFDAQYLPKKRASPPSALRVYLYLCMVAMEDEETQKRGIVLVNYNIDREWSGSLSQAEKDCFREGGEAFMVFPIQIKAGHYCMNNFLFHIVLGVLFEFVPAEWKARVRLCNGTHTEMHYQLMTFGIPTSYIPIDMNGNLISTQHLDWLKRRTIQDGYYQKEHDEQVRVWHEAQRQQQVLLQERMLKQQKEQKEEQQKREPEPSSVSQTTTTAPTTTAPTTTNMYSSTTTNGTTTDDGVKDQDEVMIETPTCNDVLLGRGRNLFNHPGNVAMRLLAQTFREEYEGTGRIGKMLVADKIVHTIQNQKGGRFLKRKKAGNGFWVLATDKEANNRVGDAFRTMRREGKKQQDYQKVGSGGNKRIRKSLPDFDANNNNNDNSLLSVQFINNQERLSGCLNHCKINCF